MRGEATVRVQPLDGPWQTLGTGRYRGIGYEQLEASANAWGPDQLSFTLKAPAGTQRPDLLPYTPVELEIDGVTCWAGRIKARPADDSAMTVNCEGWQYHLDDDDYERKYVHTRLADYADTRGILSADLASMDQAGTINVDAGIVTLGYPNGAVVTLGHGVAVTFDAGPDSTFIRAVLSAESSFNTTSAQLYLIGHDTPYWGNSAGGSTRDDYVTAQAITAAPWTAAAQAQTFAATNPRAHRYVTILLWNTTSGTYGADVWVKIRSLQMFRAAAYESGNTSILKADTSSKDALAFAPQLNQSPSLISAGTFSIPEYAMSAYTTPRQVMQAVNAFENYRQKVGGPDLRTLVFDPKPSGALLEVGNWSAAQFSDASVAGDQIFSKVIVDATGPDSARLVSKRTQSGTLVDRRNYTRTMVHARSSVGGDAAVADRFGDLWLTEHKTTPFAGTLVVDGRTASGASAPEARRCPHTSCCSTPARSSGSRTGSIPTPATGGEMARIASSDLSRTTPVRAEVAIDDQPHELRDDPLPLRRARRSARLMTAFGLSLSELLVLGAGAGYAIDRFRGRSAKVLRAEVDDLAGPQRDARAEEPISTETIHAHEVDRRAGNGRTSAPCSSGSTLRRRSNNARSRS
jgi:hypothetical protein